MDENKTFDISRKKTLVLNALELIFDEWDQARLLHSKISNENVSEELIDTLIEMIDNSFKKMDDEDKKAKMNMAMDYLRSIKEKELSEKEQEIKDVENILFL